MQVLPQTRLTFFGPRKLQILMVPTAEADEFYHIMGPQISRLALTVRLQIDFNYNFLTNCFSINKLGSFMLRRLQIELYQLNAQTCTFRKLHLLRFSDAMLPVHLENTAAAH